LVAAVNDACTYYTDPDATGTLWADVLSTECVLGGTDPVLTCTPKWNPGIRREEVTNQACLYKIWMCACWAS
jgi:hypothetical protein